MAISAAKAADKVADMAAGANATGGGQSKGKPPAPSGPLALCTGACRQLLEVAKALRVLLLLPEDSPSSLKPAADPVAPLAPSLARDCDLRWTNPSSLVLMKEVGKKHGVTVNDVMLAAVFLAMHHALEARDPDDPLVHAPAAAGDAVKGPTAAGAAGDERQKQMQARQPVEAARHMGAMFVALRPLDLFKDLHAVSLGNRIGAVYLRLPLNLESPAAMLAEVRWCGGGCAARRHCAAMMPRACVLQLVVRSAARSALPCALEATSSRSAAVPDSTARNTAYGLPGAALRPAALITTADLLPYRIPRPSGCSRVCVRRCTSRPRRSRLPRSRSSPSR
jgi:hypothetical protein